MQSTMFVTVRYGGTWGKHQLCLSSGGWWVTWTIFITTGWWPHEGQGGTWHLDAQQCPVVREQGRRALPGLISILCLICLRKTREIFPYTMDHGGKRSQQSIAGKEAGGKG